MADDSNIRTQPWFNATRTVTPRDGESDTEETYQPKADVFRVKRHRFYGREDDFISK